MLKPFRLGASGSCFIFTMPEELLVAAYRVALQDVPKKFDDRQNQLMIDYMHQMMQTVNTMDIDAMECYHSTAWGRDLIAESILQDANVEFWSVHAPYGRYVDPSSPEVKAREGAVEAYCDAIKAAIKVGAKVVVTHPGANIEYDVPRQTRLDMSIDPFRRVADYAGEHGISLAIEPLPKNEIGCRLEEVLEMVEKIDRPNVGINFDVNHLFPPEEIPALIRKAGSLIRSVHISDQDGVERHWLPFRGTLDWREVLKAFADAGYRGPLMYETHIHDVQTCDEVGQPIVENYRKLIKLAPELYGL